jgi:hypothetical protein
MSRALHNPLSGLTVMAELLVCIVHSNGNERDQLGIIHYIHGAVLRHVDRHLPLLPGEKQAVIACLKLEY